MSRMQARQARLAIVFVTTVLVGSLGGSALAQPMQPAPTMGEVPERFGFGRAPSVEEIRAWDIDVMADGTGLPAGSGTVAQGEATFAQKCAACHGPTGREGPNDRLVGQLAGDTFPFGRDPSVVRTVGNYWPYATTLYDFIYRAMPLPQPGSLEPDEVYGVVAWILHQNEIVGADAVMNAQTLPQVHMPARDRFVEDNRQGGPEIR
jgi:S-disulfanyl-L-cysteine oxidoreductase SoxD